VQENEAVFPLSFLLSLSSNAESAPSKRAAGNALKRLIGGEKQK
jgi:hypothetical protein